MKEENLYKLLKTYIAEISTARDYISNYTDSILRYLAERLLKDGYIPSDEEEKFI